MMHGKEPLYRRENRRARGLLHGRGGEYRWLRHAKGESCIGLGSMRGRLRHGRDYTPLFRFLLAHVGDDWATVYREAAGRLDRPDPIFWMVARSDAEKRSIVRVGESSYVSGLYVDETGRLARVAPDLGVESLRPSCSCCTHTFNGVPFVLPYRPA